jgi:serpin B
LVEFVARGTTRDELTMLLLGGHADGGLTEYSPFSDPEAARQLINADVSEVTHGLILELIGPSAIPATTTAALVNTLT